MKVCPECGYEDKACWKHTRHSWDRQADYCHIDELDIFEPEIAKILRAQPLGKGEYDDGLYWYKLSKKGYVYRFLSRDGKAVYNSRAWTEHPKPPGPKNKLEPYLTSGDKTI